MSELNRLVKRTIENHIAFRQITVEGEISNFTHHRSGHMYFTLKDADSRLRCVFFRGRNAGLTFQPENGLTVLASGSLTVYEPAGEYQLNVEALHPAGVGALHLAFEQLKERLQAEGLFDEQRKRPLPFLPRCVGVVTSPTGAALRDIVSVLTRRYPDVHIVLAPAVVQGDGGPPSVVQCIENMNRRDDIDVLIVGRGGGSIEELWTFNDERVARAIAASRIPVISAVGHETDVTIADFVADRRAPTPSAAAEIAVPEKATLVREWAGRHERLVRAVNVKVKRHRDSLAMLQRSPVFSRPTDKLNQKRQMLDDRLRSMEQRVSHLHEMRHQRLTATVGQLHQLSPLATLGRGYALCQHVTSEKTIVDAARVDVGDDVLVRLKRGHITCTVTGKEVPSHE